jgi:PBP1b-binding outer membrane lipoprotein LpoB
MRYDRYIIIAALAAVIMLSTGCVSGGAPSQPATDAANVTVDRMLKAVDDGDYAAFTQNFSAPMKSAVSQDRFNLIKTNMSELYGKYVSRTPAPSASIYQGYDRFIYDCQYEKSKVTITLVMNPTDVWAVEGFFYK